MAARSDTGLECVIHSLRDEKLRIRRPAIELLRLANLLLPERFPVRRMGVLLIGRPVSDVTVYNDHRRAVIGLFESVKGALYGLQVVGIGDVKYIPAIGIKPGRDVLAE